MAYYTYDYSDIVVFMCGREYLKGIGEVLSLYNKVNVFKMYSVFAIKEEALGSCEMIKDELVNCRLRATVKSMEEAKRYYKELKNAIEDHLSSKGEIKCYDTLGNDDLLIEISQVSIRHLLGLYKMKELLTHTHPQYEAAFLTWNHRYLM